MSKARSIVFLFSLLSFWRLQAASAAPFTYTPYDLPTLVTQEVMNQRIPGQETVVANVSDPNALPVTFSFPLKGWLNGVKLQVFGFEDLLANCSCIGGKRRNCLNADSNLQPCKNITNTQLTDLGLMIVSDGRIFQSFGPTVSTAAGGFNVFGANVGIFWGEQGATTPGRRRRLLATATRTRTRTRTPSRTPTQACNTGSGCFSGGSGTVIAQYMTGDGNWTVTLLNMCLYRHYDLRVPFIGYQKFPNPNESECLGRWEKVVVTIDFEAFCALGPKRVTGAEMPYTENISRFSSLSSADCSWILESPPGSTMTVVITQAHGQDEVGGIVVYDGPSTLHPPLYSINKTSNLEHVLQTSTNKAFLSRSNSWAFVFTVSYDFPEFPLIPTPTPSPTRTPLSFCKARPDNGQYPTSPCAAVRPVGPNPAPCNGRYPMVVSGYWLYPNDVGRYPDPKGCYPNRSGQYANSICEPPVYPFQNGTYPFCVARLPVRAPLPTSTPTRAPSPTFTPTLLPLICAAKIDRGLYPLAPCNIRVAPGTYPPCNGRYPNRVGLYPNARGQYPDNKFCYPNAAGQYPNSCPIPQYPDSTGRYPSSCV
mmetsp:Transcript_28962/g.48691  ORF Transcript_28962/g.48691 Transcript_28962/m.48691 type:complete len:593 (-) Transcript_28962:679-2457(-)